MPRLFTAIELGTETREKVIAQQTAVARALRAAGDRGLRLVTPSQLHLTLVFLGDVDDTRAPAVQSAMSQDLALEPFDLAFGGVGVFPPHGPARVLWLGVERGADEVSRLFEAVSSALETVGIPRERRPFSPHLTLGRWRDRGPSAGRLRLDRVATVAVERVAAVTLFQSRLLPGGAEHTRLAQARLSGLRELLH